MIFKVAREYHTSRNLPPLDLHPPIGVTVHLLPTGVAGPNGGPSQLRYRDASRVDANVEQAYAASRVYLANA